MYDTHAGFFLQWHILLAVDGCHVNCQDILSYQAVMPSMRNHQCISCYAHPHHKSHIGVVTERFPVD